MSEVYLEEIDNTTASPTQRTIDRENDALVDEEIGGY
jgi:hypothetical protein